MVFSKAASGGTKRKQKAPSSKPSKKPKLAPSLNASSAPRQKGKEKASQRDTIPIPEGAHEDEIELSDQDLQLLEEHGTAATFLTTMDKSAIARSKLHTERLHKSSKPVQRRPTHAQTLTDTEDDSGTMDGDISTDMDSSGSLPDDSDSDEEKEYEMHPRKNRVHEKEEERNKHLVARLPIKLPDGTVKRMGERRIGNESDFPSSEGEQPEPQPQPIVDDVATGARFGRIAVIDVLRIEPRDARIYAAKEQLASICQDIVADPETNLGLLRRLHTFALSSVSSPTHPEPVSNDPLIRKLAILSQCSVFRDIIPGYRIRSLTDHEKSEKATQAVMRQREFEQGLVGVYQKFLGNIDAEIKGRAELASACLGAMCSMLLQATHFNFRANLLATIVSQLSRRSWTQSSDLCGNTLITLFQRDLTGEPSLEAVRFLNRMIKEKRFSVHPNALRCLYHLRLKKELDVRGSQTRIDKTNPDEPQWKMKKKDRQHLSKKAKKVRKENKAIEGEMREAEAEVDAEQRSAHHTETLKLLFVLYFSILKAPNPLSNPRLMSAALEGIAKFAHLVNVDFFQDLMTVLKDIAHACKVRLSPREQVSQEIDHQMIVPPRQQDRIPFLKLHLLCIVTAFELLSGQGEALNIELDDFVNDLYGLILPLAIQPNLDCDLTSSQQRRGKQPGSTSTYPIRVAGKKQDQQRQNEDDDPTKSISALLFLALTRLFDTLRPTSVAHVPITRTAAFASRLIIASAHFPPLTAVQALQFVHRNLLSPYSALDALLSSEDRIHTGGGSYRADIDDVQVCNPFGGCWYSLAVLTHHAHGEIRELACQISDFIR